MGTLRSQKPFLHRRHLPFRDLIFLRISDDMCVVANELLFLWEVTPKALEWRWHECVSSDIHLRLFLTLGVCGSLDN